MLGESHSISQRPNSLTNFFYRLCCLERGVIETTYTQITYLPIILYY